MPTSTVILFSTEDDLPCPSIQIKQLLDDLAWRVQEGDGVSTNTEVLKLLEEVSRKW